MINMASHGRLLDRLPVQFPVHGQQMILQKLTSDKISEAYGLLSAEAHLGDDIGWDEFTTEDSLRSCIAESNSFGLSNRETGKLQSFIIVVPSLYSRMESPTLATVYLLSDPQAKAHITRAAIQTSVNLAGDLNYEAVAIDVFEGSSLLPWLKAEGFTSKGCFPKSGYLNNKGWTDSFVMYKEVVSSRTKKYHENEYISQMEPVRDLPEGPSITCDKQPTIEKGIQFYMKQKPRLASLPWSYTFKSGVKTTVRYIKDEEVPQVYDMFRKVAKQGEGFSIDEFPTMEIFRYYVIDYGHPFVIVNEETSKILLIASITPSAFCRSMDPLFCDQYMVVDPSFRGKGLGLETSKLLHKICKAIGYIGVMVDYLSNNLGSVKITEKFGAPHAAKIPRAAKGPDGQLISLLVHYLYFDGTNIPGSKL